MDSELNFRPKMPKLIGEFQGRLKTKHSEVSTWRLNLLAQGIALLDNSRHVTQLGLALFLQLIHLLLRPRLESCGMQRIATRKSQILPIPPQIPQARSQLSPGDVQTDSKIPFSFVILGESFTYFRCLSRDILLKQGLERTETTRKSRDVAWIFFFSSR